MDPIFISMAPFFKWGVQLNPYSTIFIFIIPFAVADPGFPMGGADLVGGAPTPEAATFRKICMSKRKNLDL